MSWKMVLCPQFEKGWVMGYQILQLLTHVKWRNSPFCCRNVLWHDRRKDSIAIGIHSTHFFNLLVIFYFVKVGSTIVILSFLPFMECSKFSRASKSLMFTLWHFELPKPLERHSCLHKPCPHSLMKDRLWTCTLSSSIVPTEAIISNFF